MPKTKKAQGNAAAAELGIDRIAAAQLPPEQEISLLNEIYDTHRIAALNQDYYAWEVKRLSRWLQIYETSISVVAGLTAASGISHASVLPQAWASQVTAALAVIAALLTSIKPTAVRFINKKLDPYRKM